MPSDAPAIRPGSPVDDAYVLSAFRRMWLEIGIPEGELLPDFDARTLAHVDDARARLDLRSFIAEADGAPVGCAMAQRFAGLYPDVIADSHRKWGYVWGVWVAPEHRRLGAARRLVGAAVEAMRADGYTRVVLHASKMGRGVYEGLGFDATTELKLDLAPEGGADAAAGG